MKFKPLACGFHSHTDMSLDGGSTVESKIKNAAKLGRVADCVTDHGIMSAIVPHWSAAQKLYKDKKIATPIKSIHGIEAYIVDPDRPPKVLKNGREEPQYMHLTIHFKTAKAYQYFCSLTPKMEERAIVRWAERKPLLMLEELEPISSEITLGSGCFLSGTLVQTKEGLKPIEKVIGGDQVLSPEGKFIEVFAPTTRDYSGKIYKLSCEGMLEPIFATANHEFMKRNSMEGAEWVSAENLNVRDFLQLVVERPSANGPDSEYETFTDQRGGKITQDMLSSEFLEIIGFFLAEGSFGSKNTINFAMHAKKDKKYKDMIESWAQSHGFACSVREHGKGLELNVHSEPIFNMFMDIFGGRTSASTKGIPPRYKALSTSVIRHILRGYFAGDGHFGYRTDFHKKTGDYTTRVATATTASIQLIDDICGILRRIGLNYSVFNKTAYTSVDGTNHKTWWAITMSGVEADRFLAWVKGDYDLDFRGKFYKQIKKIESFDYSGPVHCLSVPGPESFSLAGGLIAHNCLVGPIQKNFLLGRSDLAEKMFVRLMNLVGKDNFFAEIFPHIIDKEWKKPERNENNEIIKPGEFVAVKQRRDPEAIDPVFEPDPCSGLVDIQKWPNEFVRRLAAKYGVRCIISLDDHYACMEDRVVQEARLGNGDENWKFYGHYHSPTTEYCAEQLQKQLGVDDRTIEEWVDNSYYFVDRFKDYKLETSKDRWVLPTTEMVYGINTPSKVQLDELVKMHGRMLLESDPKYATYKERFDYEVSVLTENGVADFLPYFFVLEDAARYAKAQGIMYNTRGSAGGSLVLYLIGVSITDPIKYDLPFERFLTLGRIKSGSLPDIDSDWQDRGIILEYLSKKYGEKMALIATDMMLRLKTSILDAERAQNGFVSIETSMMCRSIKGAAQGQSDQDWLFGYKDKSTGEQVKGFWDDEKNPAAAALRKWATDNPKMWETVLKCIGICKTRGVHPGGIVLSPDEIQKYVPLIQTKQGFATAYSMKPIETIGLVKYDFLGVKTLKAQGISIKSINEHHPEAKLEWGEFAHDPRVYTEIIKRDLLAGIFQMSGGAVRSVATQINPKSIIDIALWISLMRPGAMDAPSPDPSDTSEVKAAMYYIKCAQGLRQPYYIHPDLKDILGETYGVIVTQEQGLKLFRVLADYTYETAEVVRRAIGKKEKDLLTVHSAVLKQACIKRGWTEEQAQKLYESIEASARYSFNMSHAVAYAIIGYNGCWMKLNYPAHFWKGELSVHMDDHDKLREYLIECRDMILSIDILKSDATEWIVEGDKLRPPLCLMKGCGEVYTKNLKRFMTSQWEKLEDAPEIKEIEAEDEEPRRLKDEPEAEPDHAVV